MPSSLPLHRNKVVITGGPNVGKSLLFSKICNSYSFVANYPGTTVKLRREDVRVGSETYELVDTPGLNSLIITSEEEYETRDILLRERPELIIQCADAKNIERALYLHLQLRELDVPMVFALNMLDEAEQRNIVINTQLLAEELGLPIIENSTLLESGTNEILSAIANVRKRGDGYVHYPESIERLIKELKALFPEEEKPSRCLLLLFIVQESQIDELIEEKFGTEIINKANAILLKHIRDSDIKPERLIHRSRSAWVKEFSQRIISRRKIEKKTAMEKIGWLSRHPVWGWPIMFLLLYVMYRLVGDVAGYITGLFDVYLFAPLLDQVMAMVSDPVLRDILIGDYGLLTMGVMNAIGTVIPILLVFFFLLSFLEDTGYLPNLSVMTSRLLQKVGLNGRAIMSLILALGCNTMATLTTRMLETQKERTIAIFIIALGIPCSVQLGIMLAIFSSIHFSGIFIVFGTVILLQILSAYILNIYLKTEEETFFMMELPPIRTPKLGNIATKTYLRCKWFLKEALPLFVYGSIFLLALKYTGLLTLIRDFFKPIVVSFLDLPANLAEIFIMVLARREVGAILFKNLVDSGQLDFIQILVGLTAITLFVPCISNTIVMVRETGLLRTIIMVISIVFLAILIAGGMNFILRLFL